MKNDCGNWGRRGFFRACVATASAVAANPLVLAQTHHQPKPYNRVLLTDPQGTPLTSDSWQLSKVIFLTIPT